MSCTSLRKLLAILALSIGALAQNPANLDLNSKGSRPPWSGVDSGAANAYVVLTSGPLAPTLRTLSRFYFLAAHANSGSSTLNVDSTGVLAIKKWQGGSLVNLVSGDIILNQWVEVGYDGTEYQCLNCSGIGTLAVASGGTGDSTLTAHAFLLGEGSSAVSFLSLGAHQVAIGQSGADPVAKTIPDCQDSGGNHLNFTQSTDVFSCGTSGGVSTPLSVANGGTNTSNAPIKRFMITPAGCNAGTSAPALNLPSSSAAGTACSADNQLGALTFADGQKSYLVVPIPDDFGSFNKLTVWFTTTDTTNGHTIIWSFATFCVQPNNNVAEPNAPTYNTAATVTTTIGGSAVSAGKYSASISSLTVTGCLATYEMRLLISRSTDTDTDTAVKLTSALFAYNGSYQ